MTPTAVPTLDQLAADPGKALGLPPDVRRRLALDAIAIAHMLAVVEESSAKPSVPAPPDHTLRIEEAAARLGVAPTTLARWTREKPEWTACVVARSKNMIRLSAARFEAVLRDHLSGSVSVPPVPDRRGARATRGAARFPLNTTITGAGGATPR